MNKYVYRETKAELKRLMGLWGQAKIYMVGGCVRDLLLGEPIKDIDLVIDKDNGPAEFCKFLKDSGLAFGFTEFPRFGTSKFSLTIIGREVEIECVMPRTETYQGGPRKPDQVRYTTLQEDALRRDFCCNALYLDLETDEILDPTGKGRSDIEGKILRTPLPAHDTFTDDPLRMLRAIRFEAQKEFQIAPEVYAEIKPYPEYTQLSMERVQDEFMKILGSNDPEKYIRELHQTGLLGYIIPELEEAWGFNQNSHYHSMNLTDHSFAMIPHVIKHSGFTDNRRRALLVLATLLHDIAKYKCWKMKDNGEFSYHGHEEESAKMTEQIMKRLKFAGSEIEEVCEPIRNHMIIKPLYDPRTGNYTGSPATTRRIVRKLGVYLRETMLLIDADNNAHSPQYNMPTQVPSFWKVYDNLGTIPIVRSCPVDGKTVMEEFELGPGEAIGELKDIMLDWLDTCPDLTKDELLQRIHTEFDDKIFWTWQVHSTYASLERPQEKMSGISWKSVPYEIGEDDRGRYGKEITERRAIDHPKLYLAIINTKKAREIFDEAAGVLNTLYSLPGFKSVSLQFDEYHDLMGRIDWENRKTDWIV